MLLIVKNGLSFLSLLLSVLHSSGEPQIMGRREGTLRRIEEGSARKVLDWLRARRDDVRQAGRQTGRQAGRQDDRNAPKRTGARIEFVEPNAQCKFAAASLGLVVCVFGVRHSAFGISC